MAISLRLDENNDLAIENGNFVLISGTESIDQNIKTRLQTFLGEWFLNVLIGVPWKQLIFKKPFNVTVSGAILKRIIFQTRGVLKINKIDVSADLVSREGFMPYTVTTKENVIIENNEGVTL